MILIEIYDDEGRKCELGSGFVVSWDGTAITNYHIIFPRTGGVVSGGQLLECFRQVWPISGLLDG
jgi:hypothetical protein